MDSIRCTIKDDLFNFINPRLTHIFAGFISKKIGVNFWVVTDDMMHSTIFIVDDPDSPE